MATIRGYIKMVELVNNNYHVDNSFGEFSTKVNTFTRDSQTFADPASVGVELVVLSSQLNSANFVIPDATGNQILAVGKWVYSQYIANLIPRNTSKAAFVSGLATQFPSLSTFAVGELLSGGPSNKNMPDYIRFDIGSTHSVQIWFAGDAIRTQFDTVEINVIPPVANIQTLTSHVSTVQTAMLARGIHEIRQAAEAIIGNDPPTYDTTYQLTWKEPGGTATIETTWSIIGYGPNSTDEEVIKNAIKAYLSNTAPDVDWSEIFSSLYSEAEFVLVPLWTNTSPATVGIDTGSYSPFTLVNELKSLMTTRVPVGYGSSSNLSTHLNSYLEQLSVIWRSMNILAVGSPSNLATVRRLSSIIPDYLNVPTTNGDYGRMSESTASFVTKVTSALEIARTFNINSTAPVGFGKQISGGRLYVTFNFLGFKILILTKFGFSNLI